MEREGAGAWWRAIGSVGDAARAVPRVPAAAGPGDDDDDEDETPIGDPDEDDWEGEDWEEDDDEPLHAARQIAPAKRR